MTKQKSQAAMEFLMTYGWALLVVIIVIAALAFFGLLNPARFLPEKCEIAPGISCVDFNAKFTAGSGMTLNLLVNNGIGTTMTIQQVNISACTNSTISGTFMPSPFASYSSIVVPEATTQNLTFAYCSSMVNNSRFRSDIIFTYNTTTEGNIITHVKKGYLVVQVQ